MKGAVPDQGDRQGFPGIAPGTARGRPAAQAALCAVILWLGLVLPAPAQPFTIDWHTIGGGGGLNGAGGSFVLSGTIGQPDAGSFNGGVLEGGFWALLTTNRAQPLLTITIVGTSVQICFPSPSTGFSLEQSTDLSPPVVWTPVPDPPTDNGTMKCVTLPASSAARFFRLSGP